MTPRAVLDIYSHGVRISGYKRDFFEGTIAPFLQTLQLKEPKKLPHGGMTMELKKRFYGLTDDRREAFIHRHQLNDFLAFCHSRGTPLEQFTQNPIVTPTPDPINIELFEHLVPRDYQIPIVEALADPLPTRGLKLQTGKGKTLSALMAVARLKERTVIMVSPKYFGIWDKALTEAYKETTFVTVSGSAELKMVIEAGVNGAELADFIIMSSMTYRAYIEAYEKFKDKIVDMGYHAPPPRFHEAMRIGIQINDEIQDDPGLVFRTDVFSNVKKQMYLSATPYTGNEYVTRMIDVMLPEETDCPLPDYDVYIDVFAVLYTEQGIKPKDYLTPYKNTYNHARYETQMLKASRRVDRYYAMVVKLINAMFVRSMEKGQKMLVLCSTVEFIHRLTKFLNMKFPTLRVGAHVSGSPYAKLLSNDITVSTIKSAGTGVDIPDLREVLCLQATDSKKDNIQILGRLRKLKNYPNHTPRLTYVVCQNIPNHVRYHRNKLSHFEGKVNVHKLLRI